MEPDSVLPVGVDANHPIVLSDGDSDDDADNGFLGKIPYGWPSNVHYWERNKNPTSVRFDTLDLDDCDSTRICSDTACDNAKCGVFCDDNNCNVGPACGNRLHDHHSLAIMHCVKGRGVVATAAIPKGTVLGEYRGTIIPFPQLTVQHIKTGFVLQFVSRDANGRMVFVNAAEGGSFCRFVNHSCAPNSNFEERANGTRRRMVVITRKNIRAGEEISVRYNKKVPFTCLCGARSCVSRQ